MSPEAGLLMPTVKILAALILVVGMLLALLWGVRRWAGRSRGPGRREALIRVLASQSFGPRKTLALVRVPGQVLVLGLSADRITALGRITDPELIDTLDTDAPGGASPSFAAFLSRF